MVANFVLVFLEVSVAVFQAEADWRWHQWDWNQEDPPSPIRVGISQSADASNRTKRHGVCSSSSSWSSGIHLLLALDVAPHPTPRSKAFALTWNLITARLGSQLRDRKPLHFPASRILGGSILN